MSTHARLSPSARYRWSACPASVAAVAKLEGEEGGKSSPSAIDGTHSHTLLEHCIKNAKGDERIIDPHRFLGTMLQDHEGAFGVNMDRVERVKVAVDYIRHRLETFGPSARVVAEQRVDPAPLLGRNDLSGTVDVQIICNRHVEIIDYKDGMNPVEAKDNLQLEQYAYGILAQAMSRGESITDMTLTIIQPKIALKGGQAVSTWGVTVEELIGEPMLRLIKQANATDDPNAPFVPGDKQCRYCPAAGGCKASAEFSLQKSGIKFADLSFDKQSADKQPDQMTDEQIAEIVTSAPMIRALIESCEAEALRRIEAGQSIKGLKVVTGPGRRQWNQDEEAIAAKLRRMKVPKELVWETKLISPAKAEKLHWTNKAGEPVALSEKQRKVIATEFVSFTAGRNTVVPESDSRPAVTFTPVEKMFHAVPEAPAAPEASLPSWLS